MNAEKQIQETSSRTVQPKRGPKKLQISDNRKGTGMQAKLLEGIQQRSLKTLQSKMLGVLQRESVFRAMKKLESDKMPRVKFEVNRLGLNSGGGATNDVEAKSKWEIEAGKGGLSTYDTIEHLENQHLQGKIYECKDPQNVEYIKDDEPPGHVSLAPVGTDLEEYVDKLKELPWNDTGRESGKVQDGEQEGEKKITYTGGKKSNPDGTEEYLAPRTVTFNVGQ